LIHENSVLLFEITTICNLNCSHCFGNKSQEKILTFSQAKQVFDKIASYNVRDLILTGGDPFLREDIFNILQYAKKSGIENVAITTNGFLLDNKDVVRKIKKNLEVITQIYLILTNTIKSTKNNITNIIGKMKIQG
jgi:MoaA/NifB/PqqE/SkfB family radical SAM enzyme